MREPNEDNDLIDGYCRLIGCFVREMKYCNKRQEYDKFFKIGEKCNCSYYHESKYEKRGNIKKIKLN